MFQQVNRQPSKHFFAPKASQHVNMAIVLIQEQMTTGRKEISRYMEEKQPLINDKGLPRMQLVCQDHLVGILRLAQDQRGHDLNTSPLLQGQTFCSATRPAR